VGLLAGRVVLVLGPASSVMEALASLVVHAGGRVFLASDDDAGIGRIVGALGHNSVDGKRVEPAQWTAIGPALLAALRRFGRVDATILVDPLTGESPHVQVTKTVTVASADEIGEGGALATELLVAIADAESGAGAPTIAVLATPAEAPPKRQ
jgi:hypothetical protein